MALNENLQYITRPSNADLSTKQYLFVELDSSGKVSACNSAGELAIGVLQNKPAAADRDALVGFIGVSKVVAGSGGLASNAKVTTDNTGKGVTAASTNHVLGICVKGAAAGEIAEVLLGVNPPVLA